MNSFNKVVLGAFAALLAGICITAPAAQALEGEPGRNGRIAFTSGREGPNDNMAQLYLVKPDGTGLSEPFGIAGTQNRHPSFSPDRTKVVFAAGTPGSPTTEEFDLFVHDFVTGQTTAMDGNMVGDGLTSDHPEWSPDGTRIAFTTQNVKNSAERDVVVKEYPGSNPPLNLTNTPGQNEFQPTWTPDSQRIFYALTTAGASANHNITSRAATGGAASILGNTAGDEFQPKVSPDGTKLCFTNQLTAGNAATGEIMVSDIDMSGRINVSQDPAKADYNCSWSPDGRKIAFANGAFSQGRLVIARADGSDVIPTMVTDDAGSNNFDGNPDWLSDRSPECGDRTVTTRPDTPVTLQLECIDTGPEFELSDPNGTVANDGLPANGLLSDDSPLSNPSTVLYTPNPGFTGTDRVVYTAFDAAGFGTDTGVLTIDVREPGEVDVARCTGRKATITGTAGNDVLRGTPGRDVISAGAGNDRIRGGRGADVICGRNGNDRLFGGIGRDRLAGGPGKDRINGGRGKDRCAGGPGKDRIRSCEKPQL